MRRVDMEERIAGRDLDAAQSGPVASGREIRLAEGASLLGVTVDALRKRAARGKTIRAVKRDGEWYIVLPAALPTTGRDRPRPAAPDASGYDRAATAPGPDAGAELVA